MKKIISIVALWALLATWTLWQVNAMSWMNMWEMEWMSWSTMSWWMMNMWEMNHMKKRLFSSKLQTEMDELIDTLFVNLDKLNSEKKNEKIQVILKKIENAKSKSENIKNESKKAKMNDILDYIKEKISEKWWTWTWEMMWEKIEDSVLMKDNGENLLKANKSEVVELKNWDTYTMEVTQVKKEIWNREVIMLAYNGSVPWPVIKVAKNSEITLRFVNKVKDLETTLHSHWVRVDEKYDWTPIEMMWKQKIMKYWETFEYKLKFPDEWIYWYHPHVKEELQQELWLYGNYLVEPTNPNYWSKVNKEETLILDDILLDNDKIEGFSDSFTNYMLMWRFGNTMLINWETNYQLEAKKWEVIRMYFTNASNTRPYNITIPGTKIKLVGWDNGKYEKEEFIDSFVISPWERYIVEVYFENIWEYKIENKTPDKTYTLGKVMVWNEPVKDSYKKEFETLRTNQDVISDIDKFRPYFDKANDKTITLTIWKKWQKWWETMMWMWENNDKAWIEWEDTMWAMNKNSNSNWMEWKIIEDSTKKENMDIDWKFKVWDKVKIKIFNDGNSMHPMQHPIHFHWQRFLVISENGQRPNNLVWKDTATVKTWEYIEVLVDMSNPWDWMSHCHIAEHLMSWMMMYFSVKE